MVTEREREEERKRWKAKGLLSTWLLTKCPQQPEQVRPNPRTRNSVWFAHPSTWVITQLLKGAGRIGIKMGLNLFYSKMVYRHPKQWLNLSYHKIYPKACCCLNIASVFINAPFIVWNNVQVHLCYHKKISQSGWFIKCRKLFPILFKAEKTKI